MDRHFLPRPSDANGNDFFSAPLSSSPFAPPNSFVSRHPIMATRFASPPGSLGASPLCRMPAHEGFRYQSPIHLGSNIPSSPYGSRGPFCSSFGVPASDVSYEAASSNSSYDDHSSGGKFRRSGYRTWNSTPNNGHALGRGVKRSTHQVNFHVNTAARVAYLPQTVLQILSTFTVHKVELTVNLYLI